MLPAKLYEVLPYVYLGSGISIMLMFDTWLTMVSGILIAISGAVIWVLRSDHRRSDIKNARQKYGGVLPFWLYEMLPFTYFMLALCLFALSSNIYLYPFAMLLLVIGIQLWLLRSSYRKHQRPAVAKVRPLRLRN